MTAETSNGTKATLPVTVQDTTRGLMDEFESVIDALEDELVEEVYNVYEEA